MGHQLWKTMNDTCDGKKPTLSFTQCSLMEFACNSGHCFDMTKRCDSKADCEDVSDESGCHKLDLGNTYLRDQTPPPLDGQTMVEVTVDIDLISLIKIDVVEGKLLVQIQMAMSWLDPRITFRNLKVNFK